MASEGTAPQKGPGIIRHETVVIQPPAWYYLEFENGKKTSIHAITFSIGRDGSNDLVYDDQRISSNHCMLTRDASGAPPVLKDTSRNGILVDGRKVPKGAEVQLNWGQRVELINFELVEDIRDTSMCFVVHNKTSGRIAELEKDVKDKEEALQSSQDEVKGLQQDVKNKEASAAKLTGELQSSQDGVVGLIKVQGEQEERIKSLQQEMKNKEECIKGLQHDNQDKTESAAPAAAGTSDQSGVSTADEKATGDKKEINQTTVTSLTMVLNDGFVGRVIGAGGSVLKGVIASTHCVIIVSQPDSFHPIVSQGRTISIKGKPKNIADAVEAIYKAAGEEDSKKVDRQRFTLESDGADFVVPKCTVKKMIGKEGQTIKKTRQETGVELQFRKGPKETAEEILHCTFEESTSKGGLRSIIETLLIASEPDAGAKRLYERARSESREGEGEDEDGDDGSDDRGGSSSKRPRKRARSEGDGSKDGDAGGDSGDEDRGGGGGRGAGGGGGGRGAGAGGRGAGGGGGGRGAGGGGGGRGAGGRGGGGGGGGGGGRGGGRGGGGRGAGGGGGRGGGSKDGRSGHGKSVKASRRGDRHAKNKTGKVQHAKKAKTVASTKKARKQQKKDDRKQKGNGGNKGGRVTGRR